MQSDKGEPYNLLLTTYTQPYLIVQNQQWKHENNV